MDGEKALVMNRATHVLRELSRRGVLSLICDGLVISTLWAPVIVSTFAMLLLLGAAGFGVWLGLRQRGTDRLWWVGVAVNMGAVAVLVGLVVNGALDARD